MNEQQRLYEELLGLLSQRGESPYSVTAQDWQTSQYDPNALSTQPPPQWRPALFDAVPELRQFATYNPDYQTNGPQGPTYDMPAMLQYMADNGMSWKTGSDGMRQINGSWIEGPGGPYIDSANFSVGGDERFMNAARLAAIVAGGAAANAAGQGATEGLTGWDAAMADAAQSGAITPEWMGAAGGAGGTNALGNLFPELMTPGTAGGVSALPSTASQGLGPIGTGGSMASSLWPQLLQSGTGLLGQYLSTNAQSDANDASLNLLREMYLQNRADNQPLMDLRNEQIPRINALVADPSSIAQTPDYQFQFNEGMNALNNRAAASGNLYSGNQMKAAQRYGQDYAGTKLDQSLNRLIGVANLGQIGATANQNNTTNYGTQGGNALQRGGNIRGSGYMDAANIIGSGIGDYYNTDSWNRFWGKP